MKQLLVIGGNGQLGKTVVSHFKSTYTITSLDFSENSEAHKSIVLNNVLTDKVVDKLEALDLIICCAGGWSGGSASSTSFLESVDKMLQLNTMSAALAAHIASLKLNKSGVLVLFGAEAAREATPGMVGYGMSKAATHHLVKSLSKDEKFPGKVICLLPITLDTPSNRKYMSDQDMSTWTPMPLISKQIEEWISKNALTSGDFYTIKTGNGQTKFELNK